MISSGIERFVDEMSGHATSSSAVLQYVAEQRGLEVNRISRSIALVRLGTALVPFVGMNGPDSSAVGREIGGYRDCMLNLMDGQGVPVPKWSTFSEHQFDKAVSFAADLGWPVMVGPSRLTGHGVSDAVPDGTEFRAAWRQALRAYGQRSATKGVLVTEYIHGEELHIAVVGEQVVAVTRLVPANVSGDGRTPIGDLITRKNVVRARNSFIRDYPIPDDPTELDNLAPRRLTDVAAEAEYVVLCRSPATLKGADAVDVTDHVDANVKRLAVDAVESIPGLTYAGVEIVTRATSDRQAGIGSGRSVVVKVSWSPSFLGQFPTHGRGRDIAGAILDHYLHRPRWSMAQQTSHELGPVAGSPPMWLAE